MPEKEYSKILIHVPGAADAASDSDRDSRRPDNPATSQGGAVPALPELSEAASRIVGTSSSQVYLRKQDRLLILRPNRMYFVNATAFDILAKMYSPDYSSGGSGRVDVERIVAECSASYGVDRNRLSADIGGLLTTLNSLLSSQNSVPYVEMRPTPNLKMTDFGSHEIYYPVLSEIALTYRCQLKCGFCYAGVGSACRRKNGAEMTGEQILRVIDEIADSAHCPSISFTGGEPTLRFSELVSAVKKARSKNMRVNLITNGQVLSDEAKAFELAAAGLDSAQVSLEGAAPADHDSVTGVPGSFEKTIAAVKNLKKAGVHVHTNSTITTANSAGVIALPPLLAGMGLKYFSVNMVIKTGNANINENLLIDYTGIGKFVEAIQETARASEIRLVWYSPTPYCLFNPVKAGLGSKSCAAASGLLSVSPSGDVLPCSSFHDGMGNILRKGFEDIWSSRAARYFRNREFIPPVCDGCDMREICAGGCPLYWDASGGYSEIERHGKRAGMIKTICHRMRRRMFGAKYGI